MITTPFGLSSDSQNTDTLRSAVQLPNTVPPRVSRAEKDASKPVYKDRFWLLLRSMSPLADLPPPVEQAARWLRTELPPDGRPVVLDRSVRGWPIVLYAESHASGARMPWDIPVEDFAFGFSLMTLTLLLWDRLGSRERARSSNAG